jgi:hypothetical protein
MSRLKNKQRVLGPKVKWWTHWTCDRTEVSRLQEDLRFRDEDRIQVKCLLIFRLVSIGLDNTLRTWDTVDSTEILCFDGPTNTELLCMDYLPKFGLLVTGHENGDLYL